MGVKHFIISNPVSFIEIDLLNNDIEAGDRLLALHLSFELRRILLAVQAETGRSPEAIF